MVGSEVAERHTGGLVVVFCSSFTYAKGLIGWDLGRLRFRECTWASEFG